MIDTMAIILSIVAILVSVLSARYARASARTSEGQLAIERRRQYEDLKPQLLAEYFVTDNGAHEAIRITNQGPLDLSEIAIELGERNQVADKLAGSKKIEHVGPWAIGDGDGYVLDRISDSSGTVSLRCTCINSEGESWTVYVMCIVPAVGHLS